VKKLVGKHSLACLARLCWILDWKFIDYLLKNGIKINPPEDGIFRFVTHYWIKKRDIDFVVEKTHEYFKNK